MITIPLYLIVGLFVVLIAAIIFRLVRRDYLKHSKLTPFVAVLQVVIFFVHGCFTSLAYPTEWWRLNSNRVLLALGILSAILGFAILAAAIGVFGLRRMVGREVSGLKQSGLYRWTRNPQIVGYGFVVLAYLLVWRPQSFWHALVGFLAYAAIAHIMILTEEEHLRRVFGEAYEDYCERTPRYVGLPKRRV